MRWMILRGYLAANLVIFWGFTVAFFAAPVALAARIGIALETNTGIADVRAMYGGMCLGVGVVFLLGLTRAAWRAPAVLLAVTTAAGLFVGRLLTLAADGPATAYIYVSMAAEVGAVAVGLWLLTRPDLASPALGARG